MLNEKERKEIEKMRSDYSEKKPTALEQLKRKDKAVKMPAEAFAYTFGIIGALVLGVGMCLAMKVFADLFVLGVVVGIVGIAMVCANYFIFNAILKSRKNKYAQ